MPHLADVVYYASYFNSSKNVIAAAWLHDILEDTPTTRAEVEAVFGTEIAALVDAVTDGPGSNRAERHVESFRKMRAAGEEARRLKLCDRIANVSNCAFHRPELYKMYLKEHPTFKLELHFPAELEELWEHLNALLAR